ncbi:MAG TPA: DUF1571 domain-containing protein [Gemmataceae bacterium]|nr:DUF1571 domain-containing protein [Gemmataceae bacterium]
MSQRRRQIGWCLLAASSLTWCGCDALAPHGDGHTVHHSWEEIRPPLPGHSPTQIDAPPAAANPEEPGGQPRLLAPVPQNRSLKPQEPPDAALLEVAAPLRNLLRLASETYATTPAYTARLRRREMVDGKARPEEEIQLKYRQEPSSLVLRWLGNETKNRVVLYVKGRYDDMLSVIPGQNDPLGTPLLSQRPMLRADSGQGLGKERYPVRETGIGPLIQRFGHLVSAAERGDTMVGSVKCLGLVNRPEFEMPVDAVMHVIPPGVDGRLPKGGQRLWYFDTALRFPVLVIAHDSLGQEAEYYCFDRFLFPGRLADDEFDPTKLAKR